MAGLAELWRVLVRYVETTVTDGRGGAITVAQMSGGLCICMMLTGTGHVSRGLSAGANGKPGVCLIRCVRYVSMMMRVVFIPLPYNTVVECV